MRALFIVALSAVAGSAFAAESSTPNSLVLAKDFAYARSFATKTAYWNQRGDDESDDAEDIFLTARVNEEKKSLKLVQVQSVVRHGARYPTKGNIKNIESFVHLLQQNFSSAIPSWLQTYELPYNVSVEGELAAAGAKEQLDFGKRVRDQLDDDAIPKKYSTSKFVLQHTYKSRTKDSAHAFARGFFKNPHEVQYIEHPKDNDTLLRFYDECPRYERDVKENPAAVEQFTRFQQSSAIAQQAAVLQRALNLPPTMKLGYDQLEAVVTACAFDWALYRIATHWCSLLTKEMIQTMDYAVDLEEFYQESHGHRINYEMAAVLLQDIVHHMQSFIAKTSSVVGNFRYAHGETTLPLMTLLGYADASPLSADVSPLQMQARRFRTSSLAPFSANLEFRLFQRKSDATYVVQILVNERVRVIPGCDRVFCELETLLALWSYYLTEYNFHQDCQV